MATWAIGDVHGCSRTLEALLARPEMAAAERLWFVGDLVNRGPRSREVLLRVRDLGERAVSVLGNHDVHLLARAAGVMERGKLDTLDDLLDAADAGELIEWMRSRPLLMRDEGRVIVHAGLHPDWNADEAERRARAVEAAVASESGNEVLRAFRGTSAPGAGTPDPDVVASLRALTLMRTVDTSGRPTYDFTGPLAELPEGRLPWFDAPRRRSRDVRVVCGHWAALGVRVRTDLAALDSGCAWGGPLTALRLEDDALVQVENLDR